jgi:hypothetical protein
MHVGGGFSGLMIEIKENQSRMTTAQSGSQPVRVHDVQGVYTDAEGNVLNLPRLTSKLDLFSCLTLEYSVQKIVHKRRVKDCL